MRYRQVSREYAHVNLYLKLDTGLFISTQEGQAIPVTVDITVNHLGWMEFRLCPNNNIHRAITHDCLNRHVLALADGSGNRFVFFKQVLPFTNRLVYQNRWSVIQCAIICN